MKTKILIMMIVAGIFSVAAKSSISAADIFGVWKYTISDVPPEYESGIFTFEQKDGKPIGFVGDAEKQEMKDLIIDQDKVSFSMDFQGGLIKYSLVQKGDSLSGSVSSQYGEFLVTAVKDKK